jgi:hypothetical protein
LENVLYLLNELEHAVEMGDIVWSEGQAHTTCRRLMALTVRIMVITVPPEGSAD